MASTKVGAGKLAVVTGASSGIGYELAKQFAENGFDLLITAENAEIDSSASQLESMGVSVKAVRADLSKFAGTENLWAEIKALNRPVEAIALNAGVGVNGDFVRDNSLQDELDLIQLNITSVVHLAKYVLTDMVARGSGKVLITSSVAALMPGPFYATYAASKSFLLSFAEALHNEVKDRGVTVTALMPGPTDTDFFRRAGMEDTKAGQGEKDDPAVVAKDGFDAMLRGDDRVIAGSWSNAAQGFATRFMSEQQKASIHRTMTEPGSGSKH